MDHLFVRYEASVRDAMRVIDDGSIGICFVIDGRRLVGVLTDGDVRRALLGSVTLSDSVQLAMKRDFFSLGRTATLSLIQKSLSEFRYIPIINDLGEMVDLASAERYHQVPLVKPALDGNELEYVTDCIKSGWISSQGKYVRQFEESFATFVGGRHHPLAVSNGTVALHLALVALGIGPGDEVIVPDLTFAATVNAVLNAGATPVIVDVDSRTMAMDPEAVAVAITQRTRAMIPVHLYGYPADMRRLMDLAIRHGIFVIEDCAEALGSRYEGSHVGLFGDIATFSFFGNKTITTGEGGMLLFRDASVCAKARILRDHGMSPDRKYWHEAVGYNYRLTNIQAAIGVAQLERADTFIDRKRWIANRYKQALRQSVQLTLPADSEDGVCQNSYWLYTVLLKPDYASCRNGILDFFRNKGIEARPVFFPLHRMPPYMTYADQAQSYTNSDYLSDAGICLPSSFGLTEDQIEYVSSVLQSALDSVN